MEEIGLLKKYLPPKIELSSKERRILLPRGRSLEVHITLATFWTHERDFHKASKAFSTAEADGNIDNIYSQSSTLTSQIPVQS